MGISTWTQEVKDKIAGMLLEKLPASKIAPIIGCTRSAVIGIVRRDPALKAIGLPAVKSSWPPADRARIADMLRKKMSAGRIAAHFGCTRHDIIGLVGRDPALKVIGLQGGPPPRPKTPGAKPSRRSALARPASEPLIIPPAIECRTVPMLDLGANECRWPVNDAARGELHLFCGNPASGPYCPGHAVLNVGQRFGRDHTTIRHALRVRGVVYVPATQRQGKPR